MLAKLIDPISKNPFIVSANVSVDAEMPQVSVIIPTCNRSEFLRGAIASVLNQTYQNFEIIVVDDASTDNIFEIVAAFKDERIRFIRHDTNKGGSAARNTGILASKCDYIAFLDDDDEWLPDKLRKQMEILVASPPEVGCVYTGCLDVDKASGKVIRQRIPTKRGNLSRELLIENCVGGTSAMLLKKVCLQRVGLFDENLPRSQDYDLWIRISREFLFECVPESLFKYHVHGKKISTDLRAVKGLDLLATKYASYPLSKKLYSNDYLDFGILYCLSGDMHEGRKVLLRAIKLSPLQLRGYFNLCLTLFGAQNFAKVKAAIGKVRSAFIGIGSQVGP
jgi:glycosyltransferase involved in cell wall biosynthesis